jgi:dienelactone hydrolase
MNKFIIILLLVLFFGAFLFSQETEGSQANELTALAGQAVDFLAKEDFSSLAKSFDRTMMEALSPDKLQSIWKSIIGQVGIFKRAVAFRTEKSQGYDIVIVSCEFDKANLDIRLVFNEARQIGGLFFLPGRQPVEYAAPSYVKRDSFDEKDVIVGKGEWALPGTLSLPKAAGRHPALVLIHGSGPQDRDETIGSNKPFRDLAWGLASRGIATLRFDKRTLVHRQEMSSLRESITVKEETIDDALAAISLLSDRPENDPKRIFLLGHSLGGMLIPRIGKMAPNVAGFIIMAGTARPLEDVILDQETYIFSLDGHISENEKKQLDELRAQIARVKAPDLPLSVPASCLPLGLPASYWLDLKGYDPAQEARKLKQRILILQGGRDYQVTSEDLTIWKNALGSRKNVTHRFFPQLNHLFSEGEGKITPAEYLKTQPSHVSEIVIEDIARWINRRS